MKEYNPNDHSPTDDYPKRCPKCEDWLYKNGKCIQCGYLDSELYFKYMEKIKKENDA